MGEEDRRKYYFAQQAQREPGGHYMDNGGHGQHGQVYEVSDDGKGDWNESVESLGSESPHYGQYHGQDQLHPHSGGHGTPSPVGSRSPNFMPTHPSGLSSEIGSGSESNLTLPEASLMPGDRSSNPGNGPIRAARSPLGRVPLTRTQTGDEPGIELEQRRQQRDPLMGERSSSVRPSEGRDRVGVDGEKKGRSKLSKKPPR